MLGLTREYDQLRLERFEPRHNFLAATLDTNVNTFDQLQMYLLTTDRLLRGALDYMCSFMTRRSQMSTHWMARSFRRMSLVVVVLLALGSSAALAQMPHQTNEERYLVSNTGERIPVPDVMSTLPPTYIDEAGGRVWVFPGAPGQQSSSMLESTLIAPETSLPTIEQSDGPITDRIIGSDDRVQVTDTSAFPASAVGYVTGRWPNGNTYYCTGWVYANRRIATSAHCLYDPNNGGWGDFIEFAAGKNGNFEVGNGGCQGTYYVPDQWYNTQNIDYDYGVIAPGPGGCSHTVQGNTPFTGHLRYTVTEPATSLVSSQTRYIRGYGPGVNIPAENLQSVSAGRISTDLNTQVCYDNDTIGGTSGAPVYEIVSGVYSVRAIHRAYRPTLNLNIGIKITPTVANYLMAPS